MRRSSTTALGRKRHESDEPLEQLFHGRATRLPGELTPEEGPDRRGVGLGGEHPGEVGGSAVTYTGYGISAPRRATMGKGERLEARIEAQLREWAAELESLKAKADRAVAEARKEYYEQVDELREEIEAKLRTWSKALEASQAKAETAEAAAKTLVERLHGAIQTQLRELRPLIEDLRGRAEQAEKEAKRFAKEWGAKREPARAALGELKAGVEKAWGELKAALDSAITKFREPS
jgi:hypothetical protein